MKLPSDLGMNRTGLDMSPLDTQPLVSAARSSIPTSEGDEQALAAFRASYLEQAEPIGTVPVPGTFKGLAQSALQKLTGKKPEVLIDKLGERLAFERAGTRLYEALLGKCRIRRDEAAALPLEELQHFRDEEAAHFLMVWNVITRLGADPTVQTPCADASGVAGMGLIQVIADPRTSVVQSLHAIHIAELADHDGWEMLIKLTEQMGLDEIAGQFQTALAEEGRHLQALRDWTTRSLLSEAGVS
ncbi:ferritin Dps family protein [Candidatus Nitrospira bockiana]